MSDPVKQQGVGGGGPRLSYMLAEGVSGSLSSEC